MGLSKDTTTFEIPKGPVVMDSASVSALIDPENDRENDPVTRAARVERAKTERTLQLSRKDGTTLASNGTMNLGQDAVAETILLQKKKEKEAKAMRFALKQAQKGLEAQLAALTKELDKVDKGLEAVSKLKELREDGTFDKDNAQHLLLLRQAGISIEDMESSNGGQILDEKERDFKEHKKELQKDLDDLEQKLENTKSPEERQETLLAAKPSTLLHARKKQYAEGGASTSVTSEESEQALEEQFSRGDLVNIEGDKIVERENSNTVFDAGFGAFAAKMEGDSSYNKGVAQGLTVKPEFNAKSNLAQSPETEVAALPEKISSFDFG